MSTTSNPAGWHLARGFRYAASSCGIRGEKAEPRLDLGLIVSDVPASAAGVFTQNQVRAAPVRVCQERLPSRDVRGVVVCSGNANACTGMQGLADARRMTELAARGIGCREEQFLVASTGVIGRHLPMTKIEAGISATLHHLATSPTALEDLNRSILTTDTVIKISTRELPLGGKPTRLTGLAKGAAMIGPNMATMLAFVFTDAAVAPEDLQRQIRRAADRSFNCISVEGHTSTNDTTLVLANGQNGAGDLAGAELQKFGSALSSVLADLAKAIAADAEGAQHMVTIEVEGLRDDAEAFRIAKTVADSALVKTAIFGADPNWGRFLSAAGYAGVPFQEDQVSLWLGDLLLYDKGAPQPVDLSAASAYLKHNRDVLIRFRFSLGTGQCTFWTCDLTYDYVKFNAEYTT